MKKLICVLLLAGMIATSVIADTFFIRNGTGSWTFYYVYVSDSRSSEWGEDLLGRDVLEPGETLRIETTIPLSGTTWDIMAIDQDGDTYTLPATRISSNQTITITLSDID